MVVEEYFIGPKNKQQTKKANELNNIKFVEFHLQTFSQLP